MQASRSGVAVGFLSIAAFVCSSAFKAGSVVAARADTFRIGGVVLDGAEPVGDAVVSIKRDGGQEGVDQLTDATGSFSFHTASAGRFSLTASKPTYVSDSRSTAAVALDETHRDASAVLQLHRGATISGRVTDASGRAVPDAIVAVLRRTPDWNASPQFARSDDSGNYRTFGLTPGSYIVAYVAFSIGPAVQVPDREAIAEQLRRLQAGSGEPVGPRTRYLVPILYFPGTPRLDEAAAIDVQLGEDRGGVDLPLRLMALATVSGTVASTTGLLPPIISVANTTSAVPESLWAGLGVAALPSAAAGVRQDGTFVLHDVIEGACSLLALGGAPSQSGGISPDSLMWARVQVEVSGGDTIGTGMLLMPGLHFSGHVGGESLSPSVLASLRLSLRPVNPPPAILMAGPFSGMRVPTGSVRADGSFDISGILPGRYTLVIDSAARTGGSYAVLSARVAETDLSSGIDFDDRSIVGARLTIRAVVSSFPPGPLRIIQDPRRSDGRRRRE